MARTTRTGRRGGIGRAAALLLLAALVAACGGGSDDEDTGDTTSTTEEATSTTEGTTTSAAVDPAAADKWAAEATEHRAAGGEHDYECPPDGELHQVWGTETYTDDSSVCTAAVHVGLITVEDGGTVTIEMTPGADSYDASVANGVTTFYYGPYEGSFIFPDAPPGTGEFEPSPASWAETGANLAVGATRTLECSPDGSVSGVWGSGPYTADSKICTAAVFEGLITVEDGGEVTIEIVEGLDSYDGSEANGITTTDYGAYPKAFVFAG
jgi:hypothetical protein